MVNNAYDRALAEAALANGADIVAFGRPFISNPTWWNASSKTRRSTS